MGLSNWIKTKLWNWLSSTDTHSAVDGSDVPTGPPTLRWRWGRVHTNLTIAKADSPFVSKRYKPGAGPISFDMSGISIMLYNATGGMVVECSFYAESTDTKTYELHLISDGADFATELAKIITMFSMRCTK